ncbi:MAG: tyrosine-type recombinase/integrase [Acidobacteria bacterium]|nr:tyrosine-type recombinase/integrase [Acidobacteriota bacterium]
MKRDRGTGSLIKIKGCRYWYAQFYDANGRQRRVSTRTEVKQEAQAILRNLLTDKDRGVTFVGDLKKVRYGDLRQALIQNYIERGNKSLQVLANGEETIWGLKALDDFFEYKGPDAPGVPVTRMTTDAAREFVRKRQAEGAANGTINGSLACLRRMLRIAHEDRKIQVVPKIRLLKAGTARKGFLPRDRFEELLAALPDTLKPLVTFLYYCGVRLGEALQIQWAQVDLQAGLIRLEDEQTKTGEPRTVPLPDALIRMLEQTEPKVGTVFDSTNLRKSWQTACAAVGLGTLEEVEGSYDKRYNGLIIHDLRRSAIRNLIAAGVSEKVAMTISGHKTRAVFDRYNIVDAADVVKAMRRVESLATHSEKTVKMLPAPRAKQRQAVDSTGTAVSSRG